jgi:hypothetical protein
LAIVFPKFVLVVAWGNEVGCATAMFSAIGDSLPRLRRRMFPLGWSKRFDSLIMMALVSRLPCSVGQDQKCIRWVLQVVVHRAVAVMSRWYGNITRGSGRYTRIKMECYSSWVPPSLCIRGRSLPCLSETRVIAPTSRTSENTFCPLALAFQTGGLSSFSDALPRRCVLATVIGGNVTLQRRRRGQMAC